MRHKYFLTALFGIGSAALFAANSVAGEWGSGCGHCDRGYYATRTVDYAQPTYSYAQPTITVYPHYVVQPNYVVHRTYVVPQTYYLSESPTYLRDGDRGYLVNQGQFNTGSSIVEWPTHHESYSPGVYSRRHQTNYRLPTKRLYVERTAHRNHFDLRGPRQSRLGISPYRVNKYPTGGNSRRMHYR
jgi:hypothetical protein